MDDQELKNKADEIVKEFSDKRDIFDNYCQSLVSLCKTLLRRNSIENYFFQARTKNLERLKEKLLTVDPIKRKTLVEKIANSRCKEFKNWEDICDLSGIRIIFAFERHIHAFINVLKAELGGSIISVKEQGKIGGYESVHILIRLQDDRINLPEYSDFKNLICEIQLRTLLDHAWSETSHKISYKPDTLFQKFATQKAKDVISNELKNIKEKYLGPAKNRLNALYEFYLSTNNGARILDDAELNILFSSLDNNVIYSKLLTLYDSLSEKSLVLPPNFKVCELIDKTITQARINDQKSGNHELLITILVECLKILELLRYQDIPQALELLGDLKKMAEPKIDKQIEQVYQRIFKYDYNLLKRSGLTAQLLGLNYVETNINALDVSQIKIIVSELLNPAFDGSQMQDEKTLTWFSGPLVVNDDLKSIRRKSIELILNLASTAKTLEDKLKLIKTLDSALRFPNSGVYGDDFEKMVADDANYLISKYNKLVFDKDKKIMLELPVVQELESQLNWIIRRPIALAKKEADKFIAKLDKNETYYISRILTTSIRDYKGNKNWKEAENDRKLEIDKLFDGITADNIEEYSNIFEKIGEPLDRANSWEWRGYSDILCRIASEKPELARIMLEKSNTIRQNFLTEILEGFRKAKNWAIWDEAVLNAIKTQDPKVIEQIFWSINLINNSDVNQLVRKPDLDLLMEAIKSAGQFVNCDFSGNEAFHHSLIWALIAVYNFSPKKTEAMIYHEFVKNKKFMTIFLRAIEVGIIREQISLKGWRKKTLMLVYDHLLEVNNLDNDLQTVFVRVVKEQPDSALSLFVQRITKAMKQPREEKISDRYEAVPDYFDEELVRLLRENNQTIPTIKKLVEGVVKNKNYLFNWKISELVRAIGGDVQKTILEELIESKVDDQLEAAIVLLREFESPNVELCFRIIANSSGPESKVWSSVASRLYTTGVVSGEYGIRNHYQSILKQIEKIKKKSSNSNVKQFASQMIKSFSSSIAREEKRVEEDLILRKIEFEG